MNLLSLNGLELQYGEGFATDSRIVRIVSGKAVGISVEESFHVPPAWRRSEF